VDKCFQQPLDTAESSVLQVAATTVYFLEGDVCSWVLKPSETEAYFGRYFNLTFTKSFQVSCVILYGPSPSELTNSIDCSSSAGSSFANQIWANQHVVVVAKAVSDQAYLLFSYQLEDYLSLKYVGGVFAAYMTLISCMVGCFVLFVLKKTTQIRLGRARAKIVEASLSMAIQMSKAQAAYDRAQEENIPLNEAGGGIAT